MSLPPEETPPGDVQAGQTPSAEPLTRRQLRERERQSERTRGGAAKAGTPTVPDAVTPPTVDAALTGAEPVSGPRPAAAAEPVRVEPEPVFAVPTVPAPTVSGPAAPSEDAAGFEALGIRTSAVEADEEREDAVVTTAGASGSGGDLPPANPDAKARAPKPRPRVTVVGVLGEVLLTAGVLVMLFLVWQLWLNDIVVRGEQNQAASDLAQQWETDVPPTPEPDDTDYGAPVILGQPGDAEEFGILYVPRFGPDYSQKIAGGTSTTRVLNTIGLGHYNDTQMPGQAGNFAIAGHRNTHGAPLNQIAELRVGDAIVVQTKDGYYTYRFRTLEYVKPTSVNVLNPIPQNDTVETTDALITLTSCNPKLSTAERIIAYGVFDSWRPISAGPPAAMTELED